MTTANIGLQELSNGSNQFLVANQSFAIIDAILQTRAISKTLTSAPVSPANGAVYIMASAWAGITTLSGGASVAGDIAFYSSDIGAFKAVRPKEGWKMELAVDDITYRFDGTAWAAWSAGGGGSSTQSIIVACSDEVTALTTGAAKVTFRMPYAFTLTAVRASLAAAQTSGTAITVDINESGASILSTKITIDNTEKTSTTAATSPVISDASLADDAEITIDIDVIGNGTAKGLKVVLIGTPV